jgi:DNA-3-methyladenine glycosylase II
MKTDPWAVGRRALARRDPVMRDILRSAGPCTIRRRRDAFGNLAQAIVSQQLSTKVARVIWNRVLDHSGGRVRPRSILASRHESLRALGLSGQKISYLQDLAARVECGDLVLRFPARLPDEAVIGRLVAVKGIGRWTAEMFLMFSLARPDVFSAGDLGLRSALAKCYGLKNREDQEAAAAIATRWAPWRTLASWGLWRSLENAP